jgi:glycosyltransferase involved in cell wall biosynthesis
MRSVPRERARAATNVTGNPVILWVGRLTENKDPLTVLAGLEKALPRLPGATVVMAFGDETLLPSVTTVVEASSLLAKCVTLAGRVSRDEMPNYYSAADVFISGSHSEGSGYALIEAMSSGLVPVVTDIPAFRAITGSCGARWTPGDADACASALLDVCGRDAEASRAQVRAHFDRALRWEAIAARTVSEYQGLVDQKRVS